jgi:hypothetical protein
MKSCIAVAIYCANISFISSKPLAQPQVSIVIMFKTLGKVKSKIIIYDTSSCNQKSGFSCFSVKIKIWISISTNSQRSAEKMCTCNLSSDANAEVSYLNQVQIEDVAKCNNLLMRKKI